MEDCLTCKVISTAGLAGAGTYFAYGALRWPQAQKRFLYPASAGKNLAKRDTILT